MTCECRTGSRTLVVFGTPFSESLSDVNAIFASEAWRPLPDGDGAMVRLQPDTAWSCLADVTNFLSSILDRAGLAQLRIGWLAGCLAADADDQPVLGHLEQVQPLSDALTGTPSPLLSVLTGRRIETWFQPVFRIDGKLWGHECLARARDEAGELIPPGRLFADARRERLTFMLDRICRETHIAAAGQADLPIDSQILINFLPTAIYEPAFCLRTTERLIRQYQIAPGRIIFEVVESEKIDDREHLMKIFGHYRKGGFKVALDDVGAGYAGLSMLGDLNPDLIKIDRELVIKAERSPMHRSICNGLIQIAHECGKIALAEGVETAEQLQVMRELNVDLIQGYLLGRPSPEPCRETAMQRVA